jgi:hypothetical protein
VSGLFTNDAEEERFHVFASGRHANRLGYTTLTQKGIHVAWTHDLLVSGIMPKKVLNILSKEADDDSRLVLPTVQKLQNRKKFLFKATNCLQTDRDLTDYLQKFFSKCRAIYLYFLSQFLLTCISCRYYCRGQVDVSALDHDFIRDLLSDHLMILKKFTATVKNGTQSDKSPGWIFSCRRLVENFLSFLQCTHIRHVYVSCDGTYKLDTP